MGVRIIEGNGSYGTETGAVLICSTSGVAFGPVMHDSEEAEKFLEFLGGVDARSFTEPELMAKWSEFLNGSQVCDQCQKPVPHKEWKEHQEDHEYAQLKAEV